MSDTGKPRIYIEQVKQLYTLEPVGLIATPVNALILTAILWNVCSHDALNVWLAGMVVLTIIRTGMLYKYKHTVLTAVNVGTWSTVFIIGAALSGALWGGSALFLLPLSWGAWWPGPREPIRYIKVLF